MANSRIRRLKMPWPQRPVRQLAVILFSDISGYTALMQEDEARALSLLHQFKMVISECIDDFDGQLIQYYGDGCLMRFSNALDAVRFSIRVQGIFMHAPTVPVRIGMHAGEVLLKDDLAFGDTVNLASRIESLGVPGSILMSDTVRQQVHNQPEVSLVALGPFQFKHVNEPMSVYAVANAPLRIPEREEMQGKVSSNSTEPPDPGHTKKNRYTTFGTLVMLLVLGTAGFLMFRPAAPGWETDAWTTAVAILPFENLGTSAAEVNLGMALSDEIRAALSGIPSLKVISRSSCIHFAEHRETLPQIGQSLQSSHVMEGSVAIQDSQCTITVQLSGTAKDQVEWARVYEAPVRDLASMQNEITRSVVEQLRLDLNRRESKRLEDQLSLHSLTYDMYFRAIDHLASSSVSGIRSGADLMHQAVDVAGLFSLTDASSLWLTWISGMATNQSIAGRDSLRDAAGAYLQAIQEASPPGSHPPVVEGAMLFYMDWDVEKAEEIARLAIGHGDEQGFVLLSDILVRTGRTKEALDLFARMKEVDPLNSMWKVREGWAYISERAPETALIQFEDVMQTDSTSAQAQLGIAAALMIKGQYREAAEWLEHQSPGADGSGLWTVYRIISFYRLGRLEEAIRSLSALRETAMSGQEPDAAFILACALSGMQLHQEAIHWLGVSFERKEGAFLNVLYEPVLFEIRKERGFRQLLKTTPFKGLDVK